MLFRKRRRPGGAVYTSGAENARRKAAQEYITITYDMMQKGHIVRKKRETIRQYTVMAGNCIRTVTSGDTVDRATWEALVRAGVILADDKRPDTGTDVSEAEDKEETPPPEGADG